MESNNQVISKSKYEYRRKVKIQERVEISITLPKMMENVVFLKMKSPSNVFD